jgi:hypothetical protein
MSALEKSAEIPVLRRQVTGLRIAARVRELVDHGTSIEAACRIVILEDLLEEAQRLNAECRRAAPRPRTRPTADA